MRKICFPYKRMISMLLVLICMLGLLPTAALAADAPGSIKMEDCTHNGVHYESPSLGTCWLHQMTFDYNQKSTIGFCAEHGKGMGWSLEGQTWGNPKPITDPTVQTMMAYYYAHTTGVFTGAATENAAQHALENWISSPGHFETMIDPDGDSIGVGVTERDGVTYCYLFVGCPNTHNPYE